MDIHYNELMALYRDALQINARISTENEMLKKQVNDQALEIAHCHAVCDELRDLLTKAKEATNRIEELERQLATTEADVLEREADLILAAPDDSGVNWSKGARGIFDHIGTMMKTRAALARAKAVP